MIIIIPSDGKINFKEWNTFRNWIPRSGILGGCSYINSLTLIWHYARVEKVRSLYSRFLLFGFVTLHRNRVGKHVLYADISFLSDCIYHLPVFKSVIRFVSNFLEDGDRRILLCFVRLLNSRLQFAFIHQLVSRAFPTRQGCSTNRRWVIMFPPTLWFSSSPTSCWGWGGLRKWRCTEDALCRHGDIRHTHSPLVANRRPWRLCREWAFGSEDEGGSFLID